MHNNYFDESHPLHPYTHSTFAAPGTLPPVNALRDDTEPVITPGFWPREKAGVWVDVEDHRGEEGYVNGKATTIKELGPCPDGWSATPPPPTREEKRDAMQKAYAEAIQAHLDAFAQTRNYDNIMSAATYAASTVPKFKAEGQYAVEIRDATWAKGYEILDAVFSGQRPMPTVEEVIAEMPPLEWPEVAA
jgi:hypothetical protein